GKHFVYFILLEVDASEPPEEKKHINIDGQEQPGGLYFLFLAACCAVIYAHILFTYVKKHELHIFLDINNVKRIFLTIFPILFIFFYGIILFIHHHSDLYIG
ncbi:hypothetical protein ACJX0J_033347, partial [Zea mays]